MIILPPVFFESPVCGMLLEQLSSICLEHVDFFTEELSSGQDIFPGPKTAAMCSSTSNRAKDDDRQ